jgi:hypothetical protein
MDRARLPCNSSDQAAALQLDDHLMNRRRRDPEETLEVSLGWMAAVE